MSVVYLGNIFNYTVSSEVIRMVLSFEKCTVIKLVAVLLLSNFFLLFIVGAVSTICSPAASYSLSLFQVPLFLLKYYSLLITVYKQCLQCVIESVILTILPGVCNK